MGNDDLPQDLTFKDPAVSTRPLNLHISHEPKKDDVRTPMGKLRDLAIGILLLVGFLAAIYAMSLLITGGRGK